MSAINFYVSSLIPYVKQPITCIPDSTLRSRLDIMAIIQKEIPNLFEVHDLSEILNNYLASYLYPKPTSDIPDLALVKDTLRSTSGNYPENLHYNAIQAGIHFFKNDLEYWRILEEKGVSISQFSAQLTMP